MDDRSSMRPRKGDMYIVLRDKEGEVKILVPREKITDRHRAAFERMTDLLVELWGAPPRHGSPESGEPPPK